MIHAEIKRRQQAVQADSLRSTLDETISIRAIDAGAGQVLVVARVGDRDRRLRVLEIVPAQFADAPVKFEP